MVHDIKVMKFPPYYSKKDIKKITKVNPDILIFDDDFFTPIDNFIFSDSIVCLEFGKRFNKSLTHIDLPKYLKKLKFGEEFTQSLDYVKLPEHLEVLQFGKKYQVSLFSVKFPDSLLELILSDDFNHALPFFLPKNLEKIVLGKLFNYSLNTFVVPQNLKYLQINGSISNKTLFELLPQSLKCLEIVNNLDFDMINLPDSLEELVIDIQPLNPFYNSTLNVGNVGNAGNVVNVENSESAIIKEQTNLPFGLKKLKISHTSLINYIKKIPFDCVVVNMKNQVVVLENAK